MKEAGGFSLVLGGPLFQLWLRTLLSGDDLGWWRRRVVVLTLLGWGPLLGLSLAEGHAWGSSVALTFVGDVETHVRLLVAVPLFLVAEVVIHERSPKVVRLFFERGLIPDTARTKFDAAVAAAMRLRNSIAAEVALLAIVYGVGVLFIWRTQAVLDVTSWYGVAIGGKLQPSLAGWWMGCVSLPLFQFLLLRWYFRLFIWGRFLWQVSRLELNLVPTHPDGRAGLSFLTAMSQAFSPVLLAQGAMLAGMMANRIFYAGATLQGFKLELAGSAALMVFAVLGPLLVFAPKLVAIRRVGMQEYGTLAQRYVREFDRKWLRGGATSDEPLIGSSDIQSLADMSNSFAVVMGMKWVPFTLQSAVQLAVATLLPVVPLLLTMFSVEQLLGYLLRVLF